jgi:hypothetical protein
MDVNLMQSRPRGLRFASPILCLLAEFGSTSIQENFERMGNGIRVANDHFHEGVNDEGDFERY